MTDAPIAPKLHKCDRAMHDAMHDAPALPRRARMWHVKR